MQSLLLLLLFSDDECNYEDDSTCDACKESINAFQFDLIPFSKALSNLPTDVPSKMLSVFHSGISSETHYCVPSDSPNYFPSKILSVFPSSIPHLNHSYIPSIVTPADDFCIEFADEFECNRF